MKKIAIIGANEFQDPLIRKAKALGYETHVFAWRDGAVGEKTADFFYPISIVEKDEILQKCRDLGIDCVASIGSDLAVHTVNYIARALGLPCNSAHTDLVATNKYQMRKAFAASGVYTPRFFEVAAGELPPEGALRYPVIVKPTDRSGSRGIFKAEKREQLPEAIAAACEQSFAKKAIVEEFFSGNEYSAECICWDGNHRILTFTKKYTTDAPHFIETGHVQPSDLTEQQRQLASATIERALCALDIRWGAAHAEFRVLPGGEIGIVEIGPRMGGDCIGSDLVQLSTGYDYLRMVIDTACGRAPDFTPVSEGERAEIRFIMSREDLAAYEHLLASQPERIVRASVTAEIPDRAITDSSTRYGFYIIHG